MLSVVIVSWNTRALLHDCLDSVRTHLRGSPYETIVVDNASGDGSPAMVADLFPDVVLVQSGENLGFGRGCNLGMARARGDTILLLNSDARLVDRSLLDLAERVRTDPQIGMAGPRIRYTDGALQASAHRFTTAQRLFLEELGLYKLLPRGRRVRLLLGGYWDHASERDVDWLIGACVLVRREVFVRTGGFDPTIFLYGEDEEWCARIRAAGWRILFSPSSEIVHAGHASGLRLLGRDGRLESCLDAADRLVRQRQGSLAAGLGRGARIVGAVLKLATFGLRRTVRNDDYGREALWTARGVLRHYLARPGVVSRRKRPASGVD